MDADQLALTDGPPPGHRDGETYSAPYDYDRLNTLQARVYRTLRGGEWWTLAELASRTGGSEASISARLRDLRKPKFGQFVVDRRRRGPAHQGLWEYRLAGRITPA